MKSFKKIFSANPQDVNVHQLANLTPQMTEVEFEALKKSIEVNGQLEPVKMYRGEIIDGRHRLKAIKELNIDKIIYENVQSNLSSDDLKELILKGYENRRHQTPTQKAIFAYKYYIDLLKKGEKVSQGEIAEMFGTKRNQISRVKTLNKVAGSKVIDFLFNGGKIKIGDRSTDNLQAIIKYYKVLNDKVFEDSIGNEYRDITDDELALAKELSEHITSEYNDYIVEEIANKLYSYLKNK